MAPTLALALETAGVASGFGLRRRDLTVNDTQKVTLGVIAAYVVVIAILWNVPYIRYILWPFKVRALSCYALLTVSRGMLVSDHHPRQRASVRAAC